MSAKRRASVDLSPPKRFRRRLRVAFDGEAEKKSGGMTLDEAEERALSIFDELWTNYLRRCRAGHEEDARKLAEEQVIARYDELRDVVVNLLPRMGYDRMPRCACPSSSGASREYDAIEFRGQAPPPSELKEVLRRCAELADDPLSQKVACARRAGDEGRARLALVAALAALSSRSQEVWLDATDPQSDWTELEEGRPRREHQAIFEKWLKETLATGAKSYFSNALVNSASTFRIAFAIGEAQPRPASLLITLSLPLYRSFHIMDGGGPLRGMPADWRRWPHFALQDIRAHPEGKEGTRCERVPASELRPEPAIRDLLRSGAPAIHLDAYAALAPRSACRTHGLSDIIKEELARLLRDAKAQGQAVVFMLGGDDGFALAQKVYLRPPFTDHGLRIGFLRWREAGTQAWAREKRGDDRLCIGLQLP